jgi:hypothetical protein
MPGPLLHVGATGSCPHGMGQMSITSSNTRVFVSGQPVATAADLGTITACTFTVPPHKPQPSVHVLIGGQPALLLPGPHVCISADQIPAGPPTIATCQARVVGT